MAAHEIDHGGAAPLVGHVVDLQPCPPVEKLGHEVRRPPQYERAAHPGAPRWEDCAESDRAVYRTAVRPHVEAAAPFIAAQSLQEKIPGCKLVALEGCGHTLMAEAPDATLDALIDFIS